MTNGWTPEEKRIASLKADVSMLKADVSIALENIRCFVNQMFEMYQFNEAMYLAADKIIASAESIKQAKNEYDRIMAEGGYYV